MKHTNRNQKKGPRPAPQKTDVNTQDLASQFRGARPLPRFSPHRKKIVSSRNTNRNKVKLKVKDNECKYLIEIIMKMKYNFY